MQAESSNRVCLCCEKAEDKHLQPAFHCQYCDRLLHLSCTRSLPSPFSGDVFFEYTCPNCSKNQTELFVRSKMTWVCVLILTLNHLQETSKGIANRGFFHYKVHIACFIDRNWATLFGTKFKQKKNFIGTLAGALSLFSGMVFMSGASVLGEQGWWRLKYKLSPTLTVYIIQEIAKDKAAVHKVKRSKSQEDVNVRTVENICADMGYGDLLNYVNEFEEEPSPPAYFEPAPKRINEILEQETIPIKKMRRSSRDSNEARYYPTLDSSANASKYLEFDENTPMFEPERDEESICSSLLENVVDYKPMFQTFHYDSDSKSRSSLPSHDDYETKVVKDKQPKPEQTSVVEPNRTTLFSSLPNSLEKFPWLRQTKRPDDDLTRMTEYEELHLLKKVEGLIPNVADPRDEAYLRRLRAKLALRRLKRNKHLPLFDLDNTVKYLGGYSSEDPRISNVSKERVLDRFQSIFQYVSPVTNNAPSTILISNTDYTPFQSPYSGAILKPFIRRDTETTPLWLKVTEELLRKANKNNPNYVLPTRAPIDYSYVKPQHVAAINNLCTQFFWPGIDVSESLQYPEFSCVVTYKKVVIGFALLVPDVARNTAYISFVLTRPEWRQAGVATFMLYHLLQTCSGQDVTLHVSPTNPAIFLYQKFGFKVEELVQDFYEKYFEIDSKVCKHALLLRLTR